MNEIAKAFVAAVVILGIVAGLLTAIVPWFMDGGWRWVVFVIVAFITIAKLLNYLMGMSIFGRIER